MNNGERLCVVGGRCAAIGNYQSQVQPIAIVCKSSSWRQFIGLLISERAVSLFCIWPQY